MSQPVVALIAVALFLLVAYRFDLHCLRDLSEADVVYHFTPQVWTAIIILATPIGGMTYLAIGRSPGPRR